ncbi:type I-B CRISPR-associated endonuclease Cas1b [Candidatus Aciduliprofundum boonei]|uniref:CRISPR-associated endonuclease Cas1 n=1 Tax=Aciduliprofundum boonei (strain DSM 19572 / T469) TaxID=439481 RepID=B5IHG3_ACIB4|nr:type I-B CRISPR-associated endonuclease Cas1b [Candidatus Aciduliprofundum boonei]ADD08828.1 CRISPR-associated protein Cas1 [Aciduliprofundum boonei T469]EDY34286.1 CRISPR-associated protein Cas1 [Aciduliprofundum boonei T469]HII55399.1 type I-B CRISPR-associated endonuclease Cas1 [Candidatus Aciduliprofundum boonei]
MDSLYITKEAIIKREANTIYLVRKGEKRSIPIHNLRDITCIAPVSFSSGAIKHVLNSGVVVHFFDMYGNYEGTLYPRERSISGEVVVNQAKHYIFWEKRKYIAKEMIEGIKHNILRNLKKSNKELEEIIEKIERVEVEGDSIEELMNREAQIWGYYYKSLDYTLKKFQLERRDYRPPINELNALISFGNTLLYSAVLTEIYHTHLNPSISYLHEPSERRFSLSLDIADVFKPTMVYRHIHDIVNHGIITEDDFRKEFNGVFLNEQGKRKYIRKWEDRMSSTVYHRRLKRSVSQRGLLRLEAYKLVKHVMNDKRYRAFRVWW